MSRFRRSIPKSSADRCAGFGVLELVLGVTLMGIAVAATSGIFLASKWHMQMQQRQLEATNAARAAVDMIVRDLRLGGACLPVTGDFVSLEGVNSGQLDEITTRTGLTRPDLSCVTTVVPLGSGPVAGNATTIPVQSVDGFSVGMRAYIRDTFGDGEYFDITSVTASPPRLGKSVTLAQSYPDTSGVYAIDQRRFYIDTASGPNGAPQLMLQVGNKVAQSFAVGIEKLDIQYQLQRNCPPCDVVNLPSTNSEWVVVDAVLLNVTARSDQPDRAGNYYRRTITVNVKPRNLLPR